MSGLVYPQGRDTCFDRFRRRYCSCTAGVNGLGVVLNAMGILFDLIFFPQTGSSKGSMGGWCDYAMGASIVFHVLTAVIYGWDIRKPLRISYCFCAQTVVYLVTLVLNLYHFISVLVAVKFQSNPCGASVSYEVGVILVWETSLALSNFVWMLVLMVLSVYHHCRMSELNSAEDELVEIAIQQSLGRTTLVRPGEITAEDLFNCLTTVHHAPVVTELLPQQPTVEQLTVQQPTVASTAAVVKEMKICRHRFHAKCIMQWLLSYQKNSCPVCRAAIIQRGDLDHRRLLDQQRLKTKTTLDPLTVTDTDLGDQCAICCDALWPSGLAVGQQSSPAGPLGQQASLKTPAGQPTMPAGQSTTPAGQPTSPAQSH